jgi:intracellular multiplication protein IcmK
MFYMKKNWLVAMIILLCSPSLWAAETAPVNRSNENLQQQLQTLQDALQSPKDAPKMTDRTASPASAPVATQPEMAVTPPTTETTTSNATAVSANGAPNDEIEANDIRTQAFGKMLTNTLPLSPSQIRMLRGMYDATQQAASAAPGIPPRPTASSLAVNLSPGATPPVVRLGAGFVTSLVFVDSTGAPWPIDSYSLGNPTAFNIQWDKKSNILLMQAITAHRTGNLAVILKGLNTPVMIDLNPGQAAMDVRVDLRIPGFGPEAKPNADVLPGTESPALLALLDGIPPPGAKNLKSSACESCAWLVDKKLYLRTQFQVLSPAWISTMSSADGTHVYEMQPTPLVLASYNGKTIKMRIEGF